MQLLGNQIEKIETGSALVNDIEMLVRETKMVAGFSGQESRRHVWNGIVKHESDSEARETDSPRRI